MTLLAVGTVGPASAQQPRVPESRGEMALTFAPLVKRAAPAVVNIFASHKVQQRLNPLMDDPMFRQFFGGQGGGLSGPLRERVENALGSGVMVRANGTIVTNAHVVRDADEIKVVLADKREFPASILVRDDRTDLAVLKIDAGAEQLPVIALDDSDRAEVGDVVLAIGNPFGVGQTVTMGIVSATARTAAGVSNFDFFIQTDAAINPGNSGGALLGVDGGLIGINSAIYSRDGGSLGIGFAIPANMVRVVLDGVDAGGKVVRGWLGASGQTVTPDIAQSLGLARPGGVLVNAVARIGPAADAGLKLGDVILALDGYPADDPATLRFRVATLRPGRQAVLDVLRDGRPLKLDFKSARPPEDPPRDLTLLQGPEPLAGATIGNLSPALADEIGFEGNPEGVVIVSVEPGTPAERLGVKPGDLLLAVNQQPVTSAAQAPSTLLRKQRGWALSLKRGDQVINTIVGP